MRHTRHTPEAIYRGLHGERPTGRSRERLQKPGELVGMGILEWLEIDRGEGRVEEWRFRTPQPRLAFSHVTDDTSPDRPSRLFIVGGSYRVTPRGFANQGGRTQLVRVDARSVAERLRKLADGYERTHGGRAPGEALRAKVVRPQVLVPIGPLWAITYATDKREGGYVPYRHHFEDPDARPMVCIDGAGEQLWLLGGDHTVTPHGIEDCD